MFLLIQTPTLHSDATASGSHDTLKYRANHKLACLVFWLCKMFAVKGADAISHNNLQMMANQSRLTSPQSIQSRVLTCSWPVLCLLTTSYWPSYSSTQCPWPHIAIPSASVMFGVQYTSEKTAQKEDHVSGCSHSASSQYQTLGQPLGQRKQNPWDFGTQRGMPKSTKYSFRNCWPVTGSTIFSLHCWGKYKGAQGELQ